MKKILIIVVAIVAVAGAAGYFVYAALKDDDSGQESSDTSQEQKEESSKQADDKSRKPEQKEAAEIDFTFDQPKKAAHYVSNTPEHGAILDAAPGQVSITFNFDLAPPSSISITKDGQEVGTGSTVISPDKLVLSKALAANPGAGIYTVTYTACWPDTSCHDGQFQFGVQQ